MRRAIWVVTIISCAGCAVIKTSDVTDASFKRHRSVSVFGWPVYSRVTDREPGVSSDLATKRGPNDRLRFPSEIQPDYPSPNSADLQPAEMLVEPIDPRFAPQDERLRSPPEGI